MNLYTAIISELGFSLSAFSSEEKHPFIDLDTGEFYKEGKKSR